MFLFLIIVYFADSNPGAANLRGSIERNRAQGGNCGLKPGEEGKEGSSHLVTPGTSTSTPSPQNVTFGDESLLIQLCAKRPWITMCQADYYCSGGGLCN